MYVTVSCDPRPSRRCLTPPYLEYINKPGEDVTWDPDHDYYCKLIGRLVDNILENLILNLFVYLTYALHNTQDQQFYVPKDKAIIIFLLKDTSVITRT